MELRFLAGQSVAGRVGTGRPDLGETICAPLQAAMTRCGAQEAVVHVHGYGSLLASRSGGEVVVDELLHADAEGWRGRPFAIDRLAAALHVPIRYQGEILGEVAWRTLDPVAAAPWLEGLARDLAFRIQRDEVRRRTLASLGEEVHLVGRSAAFHRLEEQIERASATDLPVLVEGEFGVEKLQVACAVHFSGPRRDAPFVEVNCTALGDGPECLEPEDCCERARGGTLFFNGVDELGPGPQRRLLAALGSLMGQWLSAGSACRRCDVRVIASATGDLDALVEQGRFSRPLVAELSVLRIEIPPLRQRREDIRPWMEHLVARCGRDPESEVDEEVFAACEGYDWPENLIEVGRIVARLDAMVGPGPIGLPALAHYAPGVAGAAGRQAAADRVARVPDAPAPAPAPSSETEIARRLALLELGFADGFHPGLRRALRHIATNYEESFSLADLARASLVSPSHLSFLFRSELGTSFKSLLALVRIERAKRLLAENTELRITDVCLEVGFGDLSHFEKTFRRIVQVNPREFRRRGVSGEEYGHGD